MKTLLSASLVLSMGLASVSAMAADKPNTKEDCAAKTCAEQNVNDAQPIFHGTDGKFPFSSAVQVGNTLYLSGQMGIKDGELVEGGVKEETKQALANINQLLVEYGYEKSDLVKCMVMLADINDFSDFNEVYKTELTHPYPARSAFAVKDLALGGSVEIECMASK